MKGKLELTYDEYINIIKGFKVPRLKCRLTTEDLLKEAPSKGDELNMNYKIEQIGYEYRGYKLGQMTDKGMIIGFDTSFEEHKFIAIYNSDNTDNKTISNNLYIDVALVGYESSKFSWYSKDDIAIVVDYIVESQPNPIQLIRKAINGHTVKLELFAEEFAISLYDSEIPICWNKDDGIHILTEVMNSNIYSDMISEIGEVVKIIEENLEWFKGCLNESLE